MTTSSAVVQWAKCRTRIIEEVSLNPTRSFLFFSLSKTFFYALKTLV